VQTFNYLIKRFMLSRQAWQAQAIVNQLHAMQQGGFDREVCIDRLLPVWEVITENLMRQAMQSSISDPGLALPIDFDCLINPQRALGEA
jgi:hypothetical protein